MKLRIGKDGFTLPLELVTSTQAILARKRSGKSYTASVEAEELLEHKQQIAVIDPTGAWWGLRSSANGKGPGYPVVVFGGNQADAPLEFRAGKAMATAIVEHGFSAIFDVRSMTTVEQCIFVSDFCAELLRINYTPIHLFIDEADTFAPQKPRFSEQAKCGSVVSRLVSQGGIQGIGVTMITQRSQKIDKDLLTQVDMLTVLRMGHPLDIAPAFEWITSEVNPKFAKEVKDELPRLPVGTAFFCSAKDEIGQRVDVRARRTFNSGATPKPGERKIEPKVLAKIDIEKLGKEIIASVQRVREESPEFLKKRIADLEKKLQSPAPQSNPERERMLLEQINTLETNLASAKKVAGAYTKAMEGIYSHATKMQDAAINIKSIVDSVRDHVDAMPSASSPAPKPTFSPGLRGTVKPEPSVASLEKVDAVVHDGLTGPEQRVLDAIAFWEVAMPHRIPPLIAVAMIANYTVNGTFNNLKATLRNKNLVEYQNGSLIFGLQGRAAANFPTIKPDNESVQELILSRLTGPQRRVLDHLIKMKGAAVKSSDLAQAAGYTVNGTFNNLRGSLRSMGIIRYEDGGSAAESWLFPEGV